MKYFAKINYLGTGFHGFQVQPNIRTVQGELCRALDEVFGSPTKVTGCSRTDAGVHAKEFCILIENETATVPAEKLPVAVAKFLPNDISLFYAEECNKEFHPRYDVISKEYLYRIRNSSVIDPFDVDRSWLLPHKIDENGITLMNKAAKSIVGTHDFISFMAEGSDVQDTVRTVYSLSVIKTDDVIEIRISANGFLYNMVRIIVGTLVEVAHGRILPEDIEKIIKAKDRTKAGMTAPASGLYLNKVKY